MSEETVKVRIEMRGNTAAYWAANNVIPKPREPILETDTGKFKVGDGVNFYRDLPYFVDEDVISTMIAVAIDDSDGTNLDPRIGAMGDLTTTVKSSVVGAINEVNSPQDLVLLYLNAKAG